MKLNELTSRTYTVRLNRYVSDEIEEKAILCSYIDSIAYSAVEKLDLIRNTYGKYIPKDKQEWWTKNNCNLENLIWVMQELAVQADKGLLEIVAKT